MAFWTEHPGQVVSGESGAGRLDIDFVIRFECMAVQIVEGKTGAGSVFDALTFYFASL